ncbi:hypothetical protein ABPG75_008352 [Micractinium tetrahymenae]
MCTSACMVQAQERRLARRETALRLLSLPYGYSAAHQLLRRKISTNCDLDSSGFYDWRCQGGGACFASSNYWEGPSGCGMLAFLELEGPPSLQGLVAALLPPGAPFKRLQICGDDGLAPAALGVDEPCQLPACLRDLRGLKWLELEQVALHDLPAGAYLEERSEKAPAEPRYASREAELRAGPSVGGAAALFGLWRCSAFDDIGSRRGRSLLGNYSTTSSGLILLAAMGRATVRVQKSNATGAYLSKFGTAGTGIGQLSTPTDVKVDSAGNIYVDDFNNGRVQKFDSSFNYLSQFGSLGTGNGQLQGGIGICLDASANLCYT